MRVTESMTTEGGAPLSKLADFLGVDDTGIKTTQDGEHVRVVVDSTRLPNESIWLDLDDADAFADLIKQRVREARAGVRP
jgi:hypothetical protein